jgi:hypothetical protein
VDRPIDGAIDHNMRSTYLSLYTSLLADNQGAGLIARTSTNIPPQFAIDSQSSRERNVAVDSRPSTYQRIYPAIGFVVFSEHIISS